MRKPIATILFAGIVLVGFAIHNFARADQLCDPSKPQTTPTSRFEINQKDGTTFDTKTKLTWKICSDGQLYSDGQCTGNATGFTWNNAVQAFGNKGDNWRLPNVDELGSIIEKQCLSPAINLAVFPGISSAMSFFWSGSSYVADSANASGVYFNDGITGAGVKMYNGYVRLVRGGQWIDTLKKSELQQAELAKRNVKKKADAQAELRTVEAQLASSKPKLSILRESLKTLRNLAEGVASNAIAASLLPLFAPLAALLGA